MTQRAVAADRVVIDAHEIVPGSKPPRGTVLRSAGYDVLVLCARELQEPAHFGTRAPSIGHVFPGVRVLRLPLADVETTITARDWRVLTRAAAAVAGHVSKGDVVLVTCHAGLNRSGLISALALHELTGLAGTRCVARVQEKRPDALFNKSFAAAVCGLLPRR